VHFLKFFNLTDEGKCPGIDTSSTESNVHVPQQSNTNILLKGMQIMQVDMALVSIRTYEYESCAINILLF
jgi:hypothetical protein